MARVRRRLPRDILARRWPATLADRMRMVDACAERLLEAFDEIDELRAQLRPRPHPPAPRPFTLSL